VVTPNGLLVVEALVTEIREKTTPSSSKLAWLFLDYHYIWLSRSIKINS